MGDLNSCDLEVEQHIIVQPKDLHFNSMKLQNNITDKHSINIEETMNPITHQPIVPLQAHQSLSTNDWEGSKPNKFKGGRKHNNHPMDELDNLLLGNSQGQSKILGPTKKRIDDKSKIDHEEVFKPRIKVNMERLHSNIVFTGQNIPKQALVYGRLIKIPPAVRQDNECSILFRNKNIGQSKTKMMNEGKLQTGIYRNYYKSQVNHFHTLQN